MVGQPLGMNSTMILPRQRPEISKPSKPKALRVRNVLVTTDFSPASFRAIEAALPLINAFNAEIHLIYVVPPAAPFSSLSDMPVILADSEFRRRIHPRLQEIATCHSVPLRPRNVHVLKGRPFEQICRLARDLKIDLIVTATRGLTGLKHVVLGSTAERVVRYSPCPVLVVRSSGACLRNGKRPGTSLRIKKILVPIDFSKCSQQGFEYARAFSAQLRSKLILMHSLCPASHVTNGEDAPRAFPDLLRRCEAEAATKLRRLSGGSSAMEIDIPRTFGHAGLQVCCRAEKLSIDLIVISTHGTTGLKHALLGSTAEYVVRHAPCSVLVVPSQRRRTLT